MLLRLNLKTQCWVITIYWSKIRIWNVEQHIMFYWFKVCIYSTCDVVISTVKNNVPSSTVCHTYICAEDSHEKALYTCTKYVIYNIQAICAYLVDVRALICWAVEVYAVQFILKCIAKFHLSHFKWISNLYTCEIRVQHIVILPLETRHKKIKKIRG